MRFVSVSFGLALRSIRFCAHVRSIRTVPPFHFVLSSCPFHSDCASVTFGLAFVFRFIRILFTLRRIELPLSPAITFCRDIPSFTCETAKNAPVQIPHDLTMSSSSSSAPIYKAWVRGADDKSPQGYIRMSNDIATTIAVLKSKDIKEYELSALRVHAKLLPDYLPVPQALTTWPLDSLADAPLSQDAPRLRAESNTFRKERDEYMAAEGRLQQKLADLEAVVNRLVQMPGPATTAGSTERAEKIADPKKFNGTQEMLKAFKDQLILKTSGNPARFPNTQQKLRYAYQFLTSKAQRTMRVHLRRSTGAAGEETYKVFLT